MAKPKATGGPGTSRRPTTNLEKKARAKPLVPETEEQPQLNEPDVPAKPADPVLVQEDDVYEINLARFEMQRSC